MITIDPIQNEFSNEDILNGFINLCIKILNEIMQRRKEQEETRHEETKMTQSYKEQTRRKQQMRFQSARQSLGRTRKRLDMKRKDGEQERDSP